MEITFSILGLILLLLLIFVFRELITEIIVIFLIALLIMYECSDDFKKNIQDMTNGIEIKLDTSSNNKIINIK